MMMSEPWRSTRAHKRHLMRRRTRGHMYCRGTQKRHTTVTQWPPARRRPVFPRLVASERANGPQHVVSGVLYRSVAQAS